MSKCCGETKTWRQRKNTTRTRQKHKPTIQNYKAVRYNSFSYQKWCLLLLVLRNKVRKIEYITRMGRNSEKPREAKRQVSPSWCATLKRSPVKLNCFSFWYTFFWNYWTDLKKSKTYLFLCSYCIHWVFFENQFRNPQSGGPTKRKKMWSNNHYFSK